MGQDSSPQDPTDYEPEGLVIRQVQWSWVWASMPWLVVIIVLLLTQLVPLDELTTSVILIIILVPRFFMSRRTRYTITDETLIYQRGGITSAKAYPLPMSRIKDVRARYGIFGRALGYQNVDIMMDNGATASLTYIPIDSDAAEQIRQRMAGVESTPEDEDVGTEAESDEPPPSLPPSTDEPPSNQPKTG